MGNSDGGKQETPHKENPSIQNGEKRHATTLKLSGKRGGRRKKQRDETTTKKKGHGKKPGEHAEKTGGKRSKTEAQVGLFRQGRGRLCGGTGLRSGAPGAHAVQLDGVSGSKAPMLNWSPLSSLHVFDGVNFFKKKERKKTTIIYIYIYISWLQVEHIGQPHLGGNHVFGVLPF